MERGVFLSACAEFFSQAMKTEDTALHSIRPAAFDT